MDILNLAVLPIAIAAFGAYVAFQRPPTHASKFACFAGFIGLAFVYGYIHRQPLPTGQGTAMPELVVGVVSGVLSSGIVWFFALLYRDSLLPRLEQLVYRGINISGEWFLEPDQARDNKYGDLAQSQDLRINQVGYKLLGTAHLRPVTGNKLEPRTLNLRAEIADRLVSGTLHYNDQSRIGLIAFLGQVEGDGRKIGGQMVFFDIASSRITADSFVWVKRVDRNGAQS
jgi:hypothetical protein